MKKILIVGAGITGCSLARLLKDRGNDVSILERLNHVGGLCYSRRCANEMIYEPHGARTFHSIHPQVVQFIKRFSKFNNYIHYKGINLNGIVRHYPLSIETVKKLSKREKILFELKNRPKVLNRENFENCMISLLGPTLYHLFVYNYTKKMWGIEPKKLTAEWAPDRITLNEHDLPLFGNMWQGIPVNGYTELLNNMVSDISIKYNCDTFDESMYDLILYSGKIDELLNFKYGTLPYRSLRFNYKWNESWENDLYGTINLPQDPKFIRKVNFKVFYQKQEWPILIQYQEAVAEDNGLMPMYPINTMENNNLFDKYLKGACKSAIIIPVGRLGLYKYLDMDKAILYAINMISIIENWKNSNTKERYNELKKLLNNI